MTRADDNYYCAHCGEVCEPVWDHTGEPYCRKCAVYFCETVHCQLCNRKVLVDDSYGFDDEPGAWCSAECYRIEAKGRKVVAA